MKSFDEVMLNEEFMNYMNKKDAKNSEYWEKYIKDHPEIKNEFTKAKILHEALSIHKKKRFSDKEKTRVANNLLNRIEAYERTKKGKQLYLMNKWIGIAAAVILLISISLLGSLYFLNKDHSENLYNEITVPSGEKSKILLSDGTIIWLNSESKLKYPAVFKSGKREVFLEGEGYFDVAKKKDADFTVITQDIKVIAMGTIFDIKSYPSDKIIETTLVEGSVKLQPTGTEKTFSDIVLQPNQKVVYRKAEKKAEVTTLNEGTNDSKIIHNGNKSNETKSLITINEVNPDNITCWKDHLLVFDNETLEEIAIKMSRWYKINVHVIDEELKMHRFTGKFINNETYLQVFEAINLTTPIVYEFKENNEVFIKRKNYVKLK